MSSTVVFRWHPHPQATQYRFVVDDQPYLSQYGDPYPFYLSKIEESNCHDSTVPADRGYHQVEGLPITGSALYVRFFSKIGDTWIWSDHVYKTATAAGDPVSVIIQPQPGSTISTPNVLFRWNRPYLDAFHTISVGTTPIPHDIANLRVNTSCMALVKNIPLTGQPIYVRLHSWFGYSSGEFGGGHRDFVFQTATSSTAQGWSEGDPGLVFEENSTYTPPNEYTVGGWPEPKLLLIGTQPGICDLHLQEIASTDALVQVPWDSIRSRLRNYVGYCCLRLMLNHEGTWVWADKSYSAALSPVPAAVGEHFLLLGSTPWDGSPLAQPHVSFKWQNTPDYVTERILAIGRRQGANEIHEHLAVSPYTVDDLPCTGNPVYVRNFSKYGNDRAGYTWRWRDYRYETENALPAPRVHTPPNYAPIPEPHLNVGWGPTSVPGYPELNPTEFEFRAGTTLGGEQIARLLGLPGSLNGAPVTNIPLNGGLVFFELRSKIAGEWVATTNTHVTANKNDPTEPANGTLITTSTLKIRWQPVEGETDHYFAVGTTPDGNDLFTNLIEVSGNPPRYSYDQDMVRQKFVVEGVPLTGAPIYMIHQSYNNPYLVFRRYEYPTIKVVPDTQPPVVTPPRDQTFYTTGGSVAVSDNMLGTATATDDRGVVSLSHDCPSVVYPGTTNVTWTAKDAAGNIGTAVQTVTVRVESLSRLLPRLTTYEEPQAPIRFRSTASPRIRLQQTEQGVRPRGLEESRSASSLWVWLAWDVHFIAPGGQTATVPAGGYWIERHGLQVLRLMTEPGDAFYDLRAQHFQHGVAATEDTAFCVPRDSGRHFLVYLVPDGIALQAVGTYDRSTPVGDDPLLPAAVLERHAAAKKPK